MKALRRLTSVSTQSLQGCAFPVPPNAPRRVVLASEGYFLLQQARTISSVFDTLAFAVT